jgi:Fibronectin type III domain
VTVTNNTTTNTAASTNTVTPPPSPPPQQPQQPSYPAPSGFAGTKLSGTSIRLSWNSLDPSPGNGYTWVAKDSQGNTKQGSTNGTNVTVSGLKPNTGYSMGVYATSGAGHVTGAPTYTYVTT